MRRLVLLVALVAVPAAGQPSAAPDAALDPLLDALALERRAEAAFGDALRSGALDAVQPPTPAEVRASVRGRLAAGATPARLDSLRAAAADERLADFTARLTSLTAPDLSPRLISAALAPPKKGAVGDSAEAVRFVAAAGLGPFMRRVLGETFAAIAARVPAAQAELDADGRTLDSLVDAQITDMMPMWILADRLAATGADQAARRRALAFAETEAGRWASAAVYDGLLDVYGPLIAEAAAARLGGPAGDD